MDGRCEEMTRMEDGRQEDRWMDGFRRGWKEDSVGIVWRKEVMNMDGRSGDSGEISDRVNRRAGCVCKYARKGNVGKRVDTVGLWTICVCASSAPGPARHI
jgi:hypothetical protein